MGCLGICLCSVFLFFSDALAERTEPISVSGSRPTREKADSLLSAADRMTATDTLSAIKSVRIALEVSRKADYIDGQITALLTLAELLFAEREYDDSLYSCEEALALVETHGLARHEGAVCAQFGHSLSAVGQKDDAHRMFHRSTRAYRAAGDSTGIARSARNLGIHFLRISEYDSSLVYYPIALEYYSALGNDERVAAMTNSIGSIYYKLGLYDKALAHFQRSLDIRRRIDDREGITRVMNNIGLLNFKLDNLEESKQYFSGAIGIARETGADGLIGYSIHNVGRIEEIEGNYEKALEYYENALVHRRKTFEKTNLVQNLNALGSVLINLGDHSRAMTYLEEGLAIADSIQYREGKAMVLSTVGRMYASTGRIGMAKNTYLESIELARDTGNRELIVEILNRMVEMYGTAGNFRRAFQYHRQYVMLKDSLFTEESAENINQLRIAYETEQKERENAALRQRQLNQELLLSRNRTIIILTSISLVMGAVFMVVLLMLYRGKLQSNKQLIETNRKVTEQRDEIKSKNAELEEALTHIKTLTGLLPICANCKKIRDDDGYWSEVESYITKHSEAIFSHGICPECMQKLYPHIASEGSPNGTNHNS